MARGTWQGSGTFQTGDDGVQAMTYCLVAGVLLIAAADWVLRHMLWIAVPAGVLLAAFIWWRLGAARRRARKSAAAYAAAFARAREAGAVTATVTPQVSQGTSPAIEQHIHYHYHVADGLEPTRVITGEIQQ
jgi:Flp pilus assembly protein TadB